MEDSRKYSSKLHGIYESIWPNVVRKASKKVPA